jgi:hypothetical protein
LWQFIIDDNLTAGVLVFFVTIVVDQHWFNADPDPAFYLNVDPDLYPGS